MKKILSLFLVVVLFAGCEQFAEEDFLPAQEQESFNEERPKVIYASIEKEESADSDSRTYVNTEGNKILWHNGDEIMYLTGCYNSEYNGYRTSQCKYRFQGETGSEQAAFDKIEEYAAGTSFEGTYAIYPYSSQHKYENNTIPVHFNSEQTYAPNSFGIGAVVLVAASEEYLADQLYFRNASAFLVIKLYGEGTRVKSITLSALNTGNKIAGDANITPHIDAAPEVAIVKNARSEVTLKCGDYDDGAGVALGADAESATEFWFALPPTTFDGGFKISVLNMENQLYQMQTTKRVELARNRIQPMAPLRFEENAISPYQLWYTRANGNKEPLEFNDAFDATILEHAYKNDKFVITFESPLRTIKANAFNGKDVTSITLPEGVREIKSGAFQNTKLTELTIPGSVCAIDGHVFTGSNQLESLSFPRNANGEDIVIQSSWDETEQRYVGQFADIPLKRLYISRYFDYRYMEFGLFNPEDPDQGLFGYAISPEDQTQENTPHDLEVVFGDQIAEVYPCMFGNRPIKSISLPSTILNIRAKAFVNCKKLTTVTLSNGLKSIEDQAFEECSSLQSISIPSSVTSIGDKAFYYCVALQSATIGGGVNKIGVDAFYHCDVLKTVIFEPSPTEASISVGQGVGSLGDDLGPFYYSPLETINLNREIIYKDTDGEELIPTEWDDGFFAVKSGVNTSVSLGAQVKTISNFMFARLPITSITIPDNVTKIGDSAFESCNRLASITFEEGSTPLEIGCQDNSNDDDAIAPFFDSPLTTINLNRELVLNETYRNSFENKWGDGVFASEYWNSDKEVKVTLGNQVKTIHKYMFNYLHITSITIPGSVTLIDDYAFDGCEYLSSITFAEGSEPLLIGFQDDVDEAGPFFESPLTKIDIYRNIKPTESFEQSQNEWDEGIFSTKRWDDVESVSVTLGTQLATISKYMFNYLPIKSIAIPSSVTSISRNAFSYCEKLTSVTMPNSVTSIGEGAFYRCSSLAGITIPSTATSIGINAFTYCSSLSSVNIEESNTALRIGYQDIDGTSYGPFYDSPVKSLTLHRNVILTDDEGQEFEATKWRHGIFANKFYNTYDANDATQNWTVKISIGDKVTTIYPFMFSGVRLTSFWLPGSITSIGYRAFHDCRHLVGVTIGAHTPPTLGKEAFDDCDKLNHIAVMPSEGNTILKAYKANAAWSVYNEFLCESNP